MSIRVGGESNKYGCIDDEPVNDGLCLNTIRQVEADTTVGDVDVLERPTLITGSGKSARDQYDIRLVPTPVPGGKDR